MILKRLVDEMYPYHQAKSLLVLRYLLLEHPSPRTELDSKLVGDLRRLRTWKFLKKFTKTAVSHKTLNSAFASASHLNHLATEVIKIVDERDDASSRAGETTSVLNSGRESIVRSDLAAVIAIAGNPKDLNWKKDDLLLTRYSTLHATPSPKQKVEFSLYSTSQFSVTRFNKLRLCKDQLLRVAVKSSSAHLLHYLQSVRALKNPGNLLLSRRFHPRSFRTWQLQISPSPRPLRPVQP